MANIDFINKLKNNILFIDHDMFEEYFADNKYSQEMRSAMEIMRSNGTLAVMLAEGYCNNDMLGYFIKVTLDKTKMNKSLAKKAIIEWAEVCENIFGLSNEIDLGDIVEITDSKYKPQLGYEPYLKLVYIFDYNVCMKKYRNGDMDLNTIGVIIAILNNYLFDFDADDISYNKNFHILDNYDVKYYEMDSFDVNKRKALVVLEKVISDLENYPYLSLRYLIWLAQVRLLNGKYKEAAMLYECALNADELNQTENKNILPNKLEVSAAIAHNIICAYMLGGENEEAAYAKRKYSVLLKLQAKFYLDKSEKAEEEKWKKYYANKAYDLVEKTDYIYVELEVCEHIHTIHEYSTLESIYNMCKCKEGDIENYDFQEVGIKLKSSGELIVSYYSCFSSSVGSIYMTLDTHANEVETNVDLKNDNNKNMFFYKKNSNKSKDDENDPYVKLDKLIGLDEIKKDVSNLVNLVKMQIRRQKQGLKPIPVSLHLVFSGNPGTGKTTIARILAEIYKEIGVLSKGQLVEVDRSGLVAGYVGQTALKTQEKIEEAIGGILFVDEAYALAKDNNNDYGQEAIDTILKAMEDHRDDFVVIVAGYTEPMQKFINSNPGLKSRFNKYINFPDYSAEELIQIFEKMCREYQFELTEDARKIMTKKIYYMESNKDKNFANARDVRNMFEEVITNQASRLAEDSYGNIMEIIAEDFN